ncbi:hypothetical protein HYDPIDRAFT_171290 [Hydnomerulius pinastri MD-312]|uniref:Uncharacterized protein n=1 Tax=Hydnomerulius pinastri MD-312 TaxID=994086 RepID=A0A0C9UZC1_9AGAM|nr:hypothetical protein HYDPIDRAFT_171290 [Hydnomerulius pinastri MD-312]
MGDTAKYGVSAQADSAQVPQFLDAGDVYASSRPRQPRACECIVQFPFALPVVEEKMEEDLAEKWREQGKELQDMAAKNWMEKLRSCPSPAFTTDRRTAHRSSFRRRPIRIISTSRTGGAIINASGRDDAALDETIKKLELYFKRAWKKEVEGGDELVEPSFNLIDIARQVFENPKHRPPIHRTNFWAANSIKEAFFQGHHLV